MKKQLMSLCILCCFALYSQEKISQFQTVTSFFPTATQLATHEITWGLFSVPENWQKPDGKTIQLAVSVLKNTSGIASAEAVVMFEGGPGAGAIEGIGWWLNHPLRKTKDIILVDTRGTGFSAPRLCPDLGNRMLEILAKDQSPASDTADKVTAALACKQQLIANGVDVHAYTSKAIVEDMHALKTYFGYKKWHVYGVSFGTYIAQVYTKTYPEDVQTLVLDAPIADLPDYYATNTSNYVHSLEKVFKECKKNPNCDQTYPKLRTIYQETITSLKERPITVVVDTTVVESGSFTYNAEDFKIAVHQSLYQRKLIEVLPLLIYQFHQRNEKALSALVAAFSGALGLDYGVYYSVTCNEGIAQQAFSAYTQDVKEQHLVAAGVSFYESDFSVCDQWKTAGVVTDSTKTAIHVPTLVLTGGFDPITPTKNGKELVAKIPNAQWVDAPAYGHAPSFSRTGFGVAARFINAPNQPVENTFSTETVTFVDQVHINGGVSNLGNSLTKLDLLFWIPLAIALLICLIAVIALSSSFFRKLAATPQSSIIKIGLIVCSLLGLVTFGGLVYSLKDTVAQNLYILAFGVPQSYAFIFTLLISFLVLVAVVSLYFFIAIKRIENRSVLFSVLFSNLLLGMYFLYWGLYPM